MHMHTHAQAPTSLAPCHPRSPLPPRPPMSLALRAESAFVAAPFTVPWKKPKEVSDCKVSCALRSAFATSCRDARSRWHSNDKNLMLFLSVFTFHPSAQPAPHRARPGWGKAWEQSDQHLAHHLNHSINELA